jgi:MFS family permease
MASGLNEGLLSGDRRGLTIGLVLAVTLVAFEALAVATVLPAAEKDLGDIYLYGWAFSAFLLTSLIGITWAGEQSDRHGPARPFVAGLSLFAIGLTIAGTAPSMWVLVLGRAVQGLGAGVIPAVAYVCIGRGYNDSQRARMLAILSTAWVIPSLAGPGIAGVVADYLNWRVVFLGLLPLLLVVGPLTVSALRQLGPPPVRVVRASNLRLATRLAAGTGMLLGGLTVLPGVPLAGAVLIVAGIATGFLALRRLLPKGTLKVRGRAPAAIAGMGILNFAFFGVDAYVPLLLTHVRGESVLVAGLALTAGSIAWTAGAWLQERVSTPANRHRVIRAGLALVVTGIALMATLLVDATPPILAGGAWMIAGFGIGMAYPSFSLTVLGEASAGSEGVDSAALKLNEVLGAALGIGIGGAIIAAAPHSQRGALGVTLTLMAMAAMAGLVVAGRVAVTVRSTLTTTSTTREFVDATAEAL